ncbi:immunoglobulin domain-containing protein [Anaerocolumna sp.]|uniref:immunoglobulin domain-containing protein n=1 Tax=Anaerocolumna sp. TaxID=2041569 RepID=UPI0028A72E69|nr:immunoglobulin domain-containing protein [Anaerocolumna sp.]
MYKILSIILVLSLIVPAMPVVGVKAAGALSGTDAVSGSAIKGIAAQSSRGAVVTGAEGKQYTLNHEYVKQLNINTGNITIDDTSYTQVNGNSESWDASSDAYVIKGQGTSTNTIKIASSNTPITVYLVDLNWNGYIEIKGDVNLIIVGDVTVNNELTTIQFTGANINISGLEGVDTLSCKSVYNTTKIKSGYLLNQVYINNLIVNAENGLGIGGSANVNIENSTINIIDDLDIKDNSIYNIDIMNSRITKLNIYFNYSILCNLNIMGSKIYDLSLIYQRGSASYFKDKYLNVSNSYVNGITFRLAEGNDGDIKKLNVNLDNSHLVNVKSIGAYYGGAKGIYMASFNATNSTFIAPLNNVTYALSFTSTVNSISHSSVANIHGNYNIGGTPVDNNANDVYLKKLRFRDYPNTYILTTFDDGVTSKLLSDDKGYLYLYVPYGSTNLSFQVTDETGSRNYGNYDIEYDSVDSDDTANTYEPVATKEPTVIGTPYFNAEIQYSFDRNGWNDVTTDAAGYFQAIIPDGANHIYIRLLDVTKYAIISDGAVGPFYDEDPIITEQSHSEMAFMKGKQGIIYVTAIPYTVGNTLTYQWYKGGELLTGNTSPVLNIPNVQELNAGIYTCVVNERDGNSITSDPITVTVESGQLEIEKELVILSQAAGKILIKGYSTELYVNARASKSTKGLSFKWYKDGTELHGETQSRLLLNVVDLNDSGTYICRVYEGTEYIDSEPITVTVENNPLEDDVANLNNIVDVLTSQVGKLSEQLNTASQEKIILQNTIKGLENQIANYQNQVAELQGNIIRLEQEFKETNENNEDLNLIIQELNNQIKTLNQQIVSIQTDLDAVITEKSILENTIIDLNYEITNLRSQVTFLENKLAVNEEENAHLINQVEELQNTLSGLNTNIINMQNEIASLTNQNNALITQVESLTSQKAALENEIQRLQGLLDDANSTIATLTEQVNNITNKVNSLTSQLEAANNEKVILQNTITDLEEQISNLNNQISELNNQVSDLEEDLLKEGADKDKLNQIIQDLNNQILSLNQNISFLQTELDSVTAERNTLQNSVTKLNNDISNLNNQITILEGKLATSEEENTRLLEQLTELQNIISGLENKNNHFQSDIEVLNNSNKDLQNQLDVGKNTISALSNLLFLIKSELGVMDDDEVIPAIKLLKAQLLQERANNVLLQQQMNELDKELIVVRENNLVLTEKLKKLMELVDSKDEGGIKDKIIDLQTALLESEQIISELLKEKVELINRLQEAENLNRELQQRIDELLELSGEDTKELKRQILDLANQINKMIERNDYLQNSIKDLNSKISELNSEKATLESEIVRLETLLDTANSTIDDLREQLADMAAGKKSMENENAALKKEIEKLKQLLESTSNSGRNNNSGSNSNSGNSNNSGSSNNPESNSNSGNSNNSESGTAYLDNSSNSNKEKELQTKLDETLKELEDVKKELGELKRAINDAGLEKILENSSGNSSENTSFGKTNIKIPDNYVVILPQEKIKEPVIKESIDKPITLNKIVAQEGWEIAPTLKDEWKKEINLIQALGTSNTKNDIVDFDFYAREEKNPEQVFNYSVEVKKPAAIPNFTMEKVIYLGNNFKLNLTNVTEDTKVAYKSLNNSIATVSSKGIITPKKSGKTTITGTAYKEGVPYQFTINVIVKEQERVTSNLKEQTIQTASSEPVLVVYKLVYKDSTTKININGYADNAVVSYISSDSTVATVNQGGIITGIKKGKATITVNIVQNNKTYNYILIVRVDDGTADTSVSEYLIL